MEIQAIEANLSTTPSIRAENLIELDCCEGVRVIAARFRTVDAVALVETAPRRLTVRLLLDGVMEIRDGDAAARHVGPGTIALYHDGDGAERTIRLMADRPYMSILFQVHHDVVADLLGGPIGPETGGSPAARLVPAPPALLSRCIDVFDETGRGGLLALRRQGALAQILCDALELAATDLADRRTQRLRDDCLFEAALAIIGEEFAAPLTLAGLASRLGSNRTKLAAVFRARTGVGPMEFLVRTRMSRARELLADKQLAIGEIAHRVGYRQQSSFTRAFVARYGLPPREIRTG